MRPRTPALFSIAAIAALVAALMLSAVAPLNAAPSVTITDVNGQSPAGGEVAKPVRGPLVASGVADTLPALVADAGDSVFAEVGDDVTVTAIANYGLAPYTYAWSVAGDSTPFADASAAETTLETAGLPEGPVTVDLAVTDSRGTTSSDTVQLFLWSRRAHPLVDETVEAGPGVPEEFVDTGSGGTVDGESRTFPFDIDDEAVWLGVDLTLDWNDYAAVTDPGVLTAAGEPLVGVNDFDLYVDDPSDVEDGRTDGATASHGEHMRIDSPAVGTWEAIVHAFANTPDTYHLTVTATEGAANPLPSISTPGPFRFELGQAQTLTANVSGGTAPLTTAWDLDLDGIFETAGTETTTDFPLGNHLVAVKTTDAAGYEQREVTAVRVVDPETTPTSAPLVVVAVTDTGVNAYHDDFSASKFPDERVLALTDNFTRHPSTYLPGYPSDAPAIRITSGKGYLPPEDVGLWTRASIPANTLHWIPGTKIVGAIDGGDTDATDLLPILDDDFPATLLSGPGHGTASASVAVGNIFGFCPTCLLVFNEDINGDIDWPYSQPWIDIVSNSYGAPGNLGGAGTPVRVVSADPMPKEAAERGQLGLFAAGNGVENGFIVTEQTYASELSGPGWVIRVGAAQRSTRKPILGTGKPVDVTSWGSGTNPAASWKGSTPGDTQNHSGTSAATPYTAGVFGHALYTVRDAVGDDRSGQRPGAVIAAGTPVEGSPYLNDGELTAAELREVVLKTTEHDQGTNFAILPTTTPATPAQFVIEGYGIAEPESAQRAIAVLLGADPVPDRLPEDTFFAADYALRDVLWGTWAYDDASGGDSASPASLTGLAGPLDGALAGITASDITDLASALAVLRTSGVPLPDPLAAATMAAGSESSETYWLHHKGGCVDGADPGPYMSTVDEPDDDDGCGGIGTGGVFGSQIEAFTALAPSAVTIPAGSRADGVIYLSTDAPADLTMTATLLAGGRSVGQATSQTISTGLGEFLLGSGYVPLPVSFTTNQTVAPGETLSLSIVLETTGSWYFGYEDDHASFLAVTPDGGDGGGDGPLAATITSPTEGEVVDPAATPTIAVTGTASFPPVFAIEATRFYPHQPPEGDTGCGVPYLDRTAGLDDVGCAFLFQGLASTGAAEFRTTYPLVATELPLTLGPGVPVAGTVYIGSDGASVHRATVELRSTVAGVPTTIGSQTVEGVVAPTTFGLSEPTPFPFSFAVDDAYTGVPLDSLSFDVVIEQSTGLTFVELDDPESYVDLPLATLLPPTGHVEVSVDDAGFASPIGATLGTDGTWGATLPVTVLADGPHTIHARAVDGEATSPVVSVGIVVERSDVPPPPARAVVEVQVVAAGTAPTADNWIRATDTSSASDFSSWTAQIDIGALRAGQLYQVYARLVIDGTEAATGLPVQFRKAGR